MNLPSLVRMNFRFGQWLRRFTPRNRAYALQFLAQYRDRTIIVHQGLSVEWLKELLSVGGGGAHFRVDLRNADPRQRSPLDCIIYRDILPLQLPLPLLLDVQPDRIYIRHLRRYGHVCLPADVAWILEDMRARDRMHVRLRYIDNGFERSDGLALDDNRYQLDDGVMV